MKDIEFIIQYITTSLIIVTPIAYTPDMIPSQLVPLLGLNPLYYYVTASQYLIVLNKFPPLTFSLITIFISCLTFLGGLWFFSRAKMAMMDLV